ncbi:MAG: diaminopimelate epimerase, partial [Pseudomonadota bacterium]
RGVGETRACGTGAAAAAAVAIDAGLVDNDVVVRQTGGELVVSWTESKQPLWLTGPAVRIFEGYVNL